MPITRQKKSIVIIAALALLAAVVAGVAICSSGSKPQDPETKKVTMRQRNKKSVPRKKVAKNARPSAGKAVAAVSTRDKPDMLDDLDDETNLTAAERAILVELQDGLDANSLRRVARTVEKIQKLQREKGMDAVPVVLRSKAVEALGWFTPDSLTELIGFMADSDPEVLEDVMSHFESAIDDCEIGDKGLSEILKTVARVLDNEDALDSFFMGIESDMRNSVAVSTYKEILLTGTEAVKARVWESVADFTGEEDINTVQKLEDWLKENPDDEDDEELYGGASKDGDSDDGDDEADDGDDEASDNSKAGSKKTGSNKAKTKRSR